MGAWLKKVALRAAGHEGLAENVLNEQGRPFGVDAVHIVEDLKAREETRYRDEMQWVHCLDTSGQVFAILLNCMYLAPLTWLFLKFFITSYLKRVERRRSSGASEAAVLARRSFQDASKGLARRLSEAVEEMHRTSEDIGDEEALADADEIKSELKEAAQQTKTKVKQASKKAKQAASKVDTGKVKQEVQRDLEQLRNNIQDTVTKVKAAAADTKTKDSGHEELKPVQEEKSPNGDGTGVGEATGPPSSKLESGGNEPPSTVRDGTSFADAVKE